MAAASITTSAGDINATARPSPASAATPLPTLPHSTSLNCFIPSANTARPAPNAINGIAASAITARAGLSNSIVTPNPAMATMPFATLSHLTLLNS